MKKQITEILSRTSRGTYITSEYSPALCGSFVDSFFNAYLSDKIKVTISLRSRAKSAKRIWIRHKDLECTSPSSWQWDNIAPAGFNEGGGLYSFATKKVKELLGEKFNDLPESLGEKQRMIPIYVRVEKI